MGKTTEDERFRKRAVTTEESWLRVLDDADRCAELEQRLKKLTETNRALQAAIDGKPGDAIAGALADGEAYGRTCAEGQIARLRDRVAELEAESAAHVALLESIERDAGCDADSVGTRVKWLEARVAELEDSPCDFCGATEGLFFRWCGCEQGASEMGQRLSQLQAVVDACLEYEGDLDEAGYGIVNALAALDKPEPEQGGEGEHGIPDDVVARWAEDCRCCPECHTQPCAGCSQGGICDALPCTCDNCDDWFEHNEEWTQS